MDDEDLYDDGYTRGTNWGCLLSIAGCLFVWTVLFYIGFSLWWDDIVRSL